MRRSSKPLLILVCVTGIIAFAVFVRLVWGLHRYDISAKPSVSYYRLLNLALGMDDYKQHNGQWPTNLTQLVIVRPDLEQDKTDAYGNMVIFTNFNEGAGYGELVSYGEDGKPGGESKYDRDVIVRFPVDDKTNEQWNAQMRTLVKYR